MIIVELMGGMGNQLFQYAAGRCLAMQRNQPLYLDLATLLDRSPNKEEGFVYRDYDLGIFNTQENFAIPAMVFDLIGSSSLSPTLWQRIKRKFNTAVKGVNYEKRLYKEPHFHYDEQFYKQQAPLYLNGYWQSAKYFEPIAHLLRQELTFRQPLPPHCEGLATQIKQTNSICLNVRRGDFVNSTKTSQLLGFIGLDYLQNGIVEMLQKVENPHFFVFSDEPQWCVENLPLSYPTVYVTHEYAGEKFKDYLQLMTLCKHFVIPNSTFAWWAAWLATYPKKIVISPKKWFANNQMNCQDLIPEEWTRI